jgi:hypothetical protein
MVKPTCSKKIFWELLFGIRLHKEEIAHSNPMLQYVTRIPTEVDLDLNQERLVISLPVLRRPFQSRVC